MVGVYLRRIWTGGACGIQNNGWKLTAWIADLLSARARVPAPLRYRGGRPADPEFAGGRKGTAMLFMLKSHISKPEGLSNKEFYGVWLKEAEAAVADYKAGVIKGIWKGAGKPEVVAILDVESADVLESAVLNFPIWKLGYSHIVNIEWNVLRPYENWYEDLKKLAVEA